MRVAGRDDKAKAGRAIFERRGAGLVLICPGGKEARLYLARRPGPKMLRRLAGDYRLFAVED